MRNPLLIATMLLFIQLKAQFRMFTVVKADYPEVEIVQVDFREYSTLVHMKYTNKSSLGNVIYINEKTCLKNNATGRPYRLLNSYNLPLSNNNRYAVLHHNNETLNFTLEFEKLPKDIESFDLIETEDNTGFNFYGVKIDRGNSTESFLDISEYLEYPNREMGYYYKDGDVVEYYVDGGIKIAVRLDYNENYGKHYQAQILIQNLSGIEVNIDPMQIRAMYNVKTPEVAKVIGYDEYMKTVRRSQRFEAFVFDFSQRAAASGAGYSQSRTNSHTTGNISTNLTAEAKTYGRVYGYVGNIYGSVYGSSYSYYTGNSNSNYSEQTTSTTQSFNAREANDARQNAARNSADYHNNQGEIRQTISQGYLKLNTVMNETEYQGYVNIIYKKTDRVQIVVPVGGKEYRFIFNSK